MSDVQETVSGPEVAAAPSSGPTTAQTPQSLIYAIVDALMSGVDKLPALADRVGLDGSDPEVLRQLSGLLKLPDVINGVALARKDVTTHVVERFKRDAPLYADVVRQIALDEKIGPKTRLAAAQDGLNRAGTGAAQKLSIDTPRAYAERLKDLLEPADNSEAEKIGGTE